MGSILFDTFLSHPDKLYIEHIGRMMGVNDTKLEQHVKLFHDIAKLKNNFQAYIREPEKGGSEKNHSLLSAYLFLLNSDFEPKEILFGFLAIASHHGDVENFFELGEANKYIGKYATNSKELNFLDEVIFHANALDFYDEVTGTLTTLEEKIKTYQRYLRTLKRQKSLGYQDFIDFKKLYASLIYADKYEAIFSLSKEKHKKIECSVLTQHIDSFPYHAKRDTFRKFVLGNFDNNHKLFTLTAPTGYGKTLTALEFALQFQKEKIIFALPFTSIIDQTETVITDVFKESEIDIFKVHHKTTVNEAKDEDRYSEVKFLMSSLSGEINITTLYQIIFALFGNSNKDNVKFNQLRDSVIIIDEAQSIPYGFRRDFIKLCELISEQMNTVFIFMSATMPIMGDNFKEISDQDYFKEQNRYRLEWLPLDNTQETLIEKITQEAQNKHTLCVVNTIKKAQELYHYFKDKFTCYSLNGYMTDHDKQQTIQRVQTALQQSQEKILLISTQSIEAGVDLDFEVGFREVAPISSIIQTAGRVNRHFGANQGTLYIFDDICQYSNLIYGDLQQISQTIFEILQQNSVQESSILEISQLYFQKIRTQLERHYFENEMQTLEFLTINERVKEIMDNNDFKELIIIEPYDGFIKEREAELLEIKKRKVDKFKQRDFTQGVVKKILQYGVNVSKKDILGFNTRPNKIKYLFEMLYLPYGATEYSSDYGIKKYKPENDATDIGFDF